MERTGGDGRSTTRLGGQSRDELSRDGLSLDEQYEAARQLIVSAAQVLRETGERYRERYRSAPGGPTGTGSEESARGRVELAKIGLAVAHLDRTSLFLERDSTVRFEDVVELPVDLQVRIVDAQEAERQRLAQEVHDGPAQALTNAIFQVEYIERLLVRDPAAARGEMKFLRDRLRRELADVRTFITQLRPPLLDEIGLYGAVRDQAAGLAEAAGTTVEVNLEAPSEVLGDTQQTVILRIVQEALQNIRRHAGASHVLLQSRLVGVADTARDGGRDWVLEIRDDGRGFDPAQTDATPGGRSFGLRFMRERAELIGARLQIDSKPGEGTRICVTLPGDMERR